MEKLHFPALMNRCSVQTGFSKTSSQFGRVMTAGFSAFFFLSRLSVGVDWQLTDENLKVHEYSCWVIGFGLANFLCWSPKNTWRNVHLFFFHAQRFHAWAKSILQSPVPILAHRYVNTTRSGCCTTMIPCVPKWSHQPSPQMHVSVAFSPLQKKKIISVDIILFQTKIRGLDTPTLQKLKIFWGHIYTWQVYIHWVK